ncbi:MAG: FAD-dependent oxidoreductase [Candidatus Omnitrophica bacterium]|nr:FAD-dependent oxidoreductase [Candidatus Omnitrophota bacterium]
MGVNKFDIIIIGGGIAGLVCGNLLAKIGLKVLICEKNHYVGGCCCSFIRKGYKLESGIHTIEGYRSHINRLIEELELKIEVARREVTDIIILPQQEVKIYSEFVRTKEFFRQIGIDKDEIEKLESLLSADWRKVIDLNSFKSAKELIQHFFRDDNLREILCILARNIATPMQYLSPVNYTIFLKQYLTDNGYYFPEGIDKFPSILQKQFKKNGGVLRLKAQVINFIIENNKAKGVRLANGEEFFAERFIVAADHFDMVRNLPDKNLENDLEKLKTTLSVFIIYFILPNRVRNKIEETNALWIVSNFNTEENFASLFAGLDKKALYDNSVIMVGFMPKKEDYFGAYCISSAQFASKVQWEKVRSIYKEEILKIVKKATGINIEKEALFIETATPHTLYKFTNNYRGALHGWAPTPAQIKFSIANRVKINNIYFTGHWVTGYSQGGIPWAIETARRTAERIMRENGS